MDRIILLDNIRSMYNVGSIFRTCDGAGVKELWLTGYTATPPRSQISKTALGSEESVTWHHRATALEAVEELKRKGVYVVGTETEEKAELIDDITLPTDRPVCFVLGNEVEGIQEEVLQACDALMAIPMHGMKVSLNVSVTAGIVAYFPFESLGK